MMLQEKIKREALLPGIDLTSLMCLSAVDQKDKLAVVYNMDSMKHKHRITVKVELADRTAPHVPTVSTVFGTADWHEREVYDVMGIVLDSHHDLRRILLPGRLGGMAPAQRVCRSGERSRLESSVSGRSGSESRALGIT